MNSPQRVLRYEIPVDHASHAVDLTGTIVHVDCRKYDRVEIWAIDVPGHPAATRTFQVFGTGEDLPAGAQHIATTLAPASTVQVRGALVWHLFERK